MSTQPEALRLARIIDGDFVAGITIFEVDVRKAAAELRRLSAIEQAAKNLVKVKGRFHTEQAFNRLKDLLK